MQSPQQAKFKPKSPKQYIRQHTYARGRKSIWTNRPSSSWPFPTGAKLFTITSQNNAINQLKISNFFPEKHAKILRDLHQHFYHLFFFNTPELPDDFRLCDRELTFTSLGPDAKPVQYRFSGRPLVLAAKREKGLLTTRWQCQYHTIERFGRYWRPGVVTAKLAGSAFRCDLDFIRFTVLTQPPPNSHPNPTSN